jgi:indolepyruvate ferredoxin oxidoreductase, alpha subunit
MTATTATSPTRTLLSGNEAFARGAFEAGVRVASGYPGTPSTEILQSLARYDGIDVRWAPNEKVGMDVALGASLGGVRALTSMKHVGMNVAADTFLTASYTGVGAGLVVVVADDPGMHSSQNEQDTRFYARFAAVPLLEPSGSSEARAFVPLAFHLSEEFDTPVLVRSTTRVSHNRGVVETGPRETRPPAGFRRDPAKYVMLPAHARLRRPVVLDRLARLQAYAEASSLTVEEDGDPRTGVVTSGIAYRYVREVLPDVRVLKLGMTYPLAVERVRAFAASVDRLLVVEELEPFLEEAIRAAGIAVEGKAFISRTGELDPDIVRDGLVQAGVLAPTSSIWAVPGPNHTDGTDGSARDAHVAPAPMPATIARPPVLCPGCPHTTPYMVLRRLGAVIAGDIGCYTLAALPPLSTMDTCLAMGSSIGMAVGLAASGGSPAPVVATIGDSTFLHGGIPGLMDAVYNSADITVVILDNGTVAMTGGQEHPGTGRTLAGQETRAVDLVALCRALGVDDVRVVDPYDLAATYTTLEAAIAHRGPSVVITNRPCVVYPRKVRDQPFDVVADACIACQACMNLGCPSILWAEETYEGRPKVSIDTATCTGCAMCPQLCPPGAIIPMPDWEDANRD